MTTSLIPFKHHAYSKNSTAKVSWAEYLIEWEMISVERITCYSRDIACLVPSEI
jgi:hypothetical protein